MKVPLSSAILLAIIVVGILVRFTNFTSPPVDAHSMRQIDTDSVAYNFATKDLDILYPHNFLIRPTTNTQAYFLLEFPAYEYILGLLYKGIAYSWAVARALNLVLYVVASLSLYLFAKSLMSERAALVAVFLFSFVPGSIFFLGHAIHPDVFATTMLLVSLASYVKFSKTHHISLLILASVAIGLAVATRPFILIVYPAFLWLLYSRKAKWWDYAALTVGAGSIYGLWQLWILRFKATADPSWEQWVLGGRATLLNFGVLVKQLILKNVAGEVMGKILSGLFVMALIAAPFIRKRLNSPALIFLLLWLVMIPVYWVMVPDGNIVHQYYADIYIVPVTLLVAMVGTKLLSLLSNRFELAAYAFLAVALFYNGWHTSLYFFHYINGTDTVIAHQIAEAVPPDAKLVYLGTNYVPFSLAHRTGWIVGNPNQALPATDVPATASAVMSMKDYGALYVVAAKGDISMTQLELNALKMHMTTVSSSEQVDIYRLN